MLRCASPPPWFTQFVPPPALHGLARATLVSVRRFYVGAKALLSRDGAYLLLQEARREAAWDLPGGRLEGTETLEQALERELREELPGIADIRIGPQLGSAPLGALRGEVGLLLVVYAAEASLPAELRLSPDHRAHAWLPLEDARRRLPPELGPILERHAAASRRGC